MIVERKDDGSVYSYCHRCSKSGNYDSPYARAGKLSKADSSRATKSAGYRRRVELYASADRRPDEWPDEIRRWVRQYGLTDRELVENDLRYCEEIDGLFITVRNNIGPIGYSLRRFNWEGPKYLLDIANDSGPAVHLPPNTFPNRTVVLTEDSLSAIKVSRHANACACLGTSPSVDVLSWLVRTYDDFVIFFDDDNMIVKRQQRVLRNTLNNMGTARIITGVGCDPKECSNTRLRELVT